MFFGLIAEAIHKEPLSVGKKCHIEARSLLLTMDFKNQLKFEFILENIAS